MSKKHIPLIGSDAACPETGCLHLPRLWLKASLDDQGLLADGYPACGNGFDQMTLDSLGIDRGKFLDHIKKDKPTYVQTVAWIKAQPGSKTDKDTVRVHNAAIIAYNHDDDTRNGIIHKCGLDPATTPKDAVNLNKHEDWHDNHIANRPVEEKPAPSNPPLAAAEGDVVRNAGAHAVKAELVGAGAGNDATM